MFFVVKGGELYFSRERVKKRARRREKKKLVLRQKKKERVA